MVELESHHFGTTHEITQTSKIHQRLLTTQWRVLGDRCEAQRQSTFTPRTCPSPRKSLTFRSGDPAVVLPPVTEPSVSDQCHAVRSPQSPTYNAGPEANCASRPNFTTTDNTRHTSKSSAAPWHLTNTEWWHCTRQLAWSLQIINVIKKPKAD